MNPDVVSKGIYLDFEKQIEDEKPAIAGVLIDEDYSCFGLDPTLECAVTYLQSNRVNEEWNFQDANTFAQNILERAENEERLIIGYTNAERDLLVELTGEQVRIDNVYFDANFSPWFREKYRRTYRRLLRENRNDSRWRTNRRVGLKDYLSLDWIGYPYPPDLKNYSPATALGRMRTEIQSRGGYQNVPRSVKKKFTMIYRYNFHDCKGMRHLLEFRLSRDSNR